MSISRPIPYRPTASPVLARSRAPRSAAPSPAKPNFKSPPKADASILLRKWHLLRKSAPYVLAATALGVAMAWRDRPSQTPYYTASTTVRFNDARAYLTSGVTNRFISNIYANPATDELELVQTRATRERAVDAGALQITALGSASVNWLSSFDLSKATSAAVLSMSFDDTNATAQYRGERVTAPYGSPLRIGGIAFQVPAKPSASSGVFEIVPRETAIALLSGVSASNRKETNVIDLSFSGHDPVYVQRALNAMTEALQATSALAEQRAAQEKRQFLDEQHDRIEATLTERRAQLANFRARNQTFDAMAKGSAAQTAVADLQRRRDELAAEREVFNTLLSNAIAARKAGDASKLRSLMSSPDLVSNPVLARLSAQLRNKTFARDTLTKGPFGSSETNPDVQSITAQIQALADQVADAAKSNVTMIDARIQGLDALVARTTQDAASLPATQAEQDRLVQEEQAAQRAADQIQDERQRAAIAEGADVGKIEIIDLVDELPTKVTPHSSIRKFILNGTAAFLVAVMIILLLDEFNNKLRHRSDIEKLLSLPTLGSIPSLARISVRGPARTLSRLPGAKPREGRSLAQVTRSPAFESYRSIRTGLIFSNAVKKLRTIAITSASPGDGKSTTIANLGIAFAQQGVRVLVIDCDLRRGSLHKMFDVPRLPGLTHAVAGGLDLRSVVKDTAVGNLSVLTTGLQPPNPGEFLASAGLRNLLVEAQKQFDVILIDTPPVMAAADASMVASLADGAVLLVKVGDTTKKAAKTAQERLQLSGARILGTILNDPKELLQSTEEYYNYYYYDYQPQAATA